jgi:hypothetical protein
MPLRYLLSVIIGTALVFVWGGIAWAGGLYDHWLRPMPGGDSIVRVLDDAAPATGMYVFPAPVDAESLNTATELEAALKARRERYARGPIIMMALTRGERDPDDTTFMLKGALIEFFATAMLASVVGLAGAGHGPFRRCMALLAVVTFMNVGTHMVAWAFLFAPGDFTAVLMFDGLVGWTLAGLPAVFLLRARRPGDPLAA